MNYSIPQEKEERVNQEVRVSELFNTHTSHIITVRVCQQEVRVSEIFTTPLST